ncbi:MAG: response regulator [Bacteroidales bacterium]
MVSATKKLLLIEDDKDLRETTCEFLNDEGFCALSAESGSKGVQMAIEHTPDIILCDINLPGINGYEVYNMLHQINTTSVIPFVFLTAKSSKEDILAGMHLGADDYITKPFEFLDLVNTINKRIESRQKIANLHEQKFNALFQNIENGACVLDDRNTIQFANKPLSNILGYSLDELSGLPITNIVHRNSLPSLTKTLEQCAEGVKLSFSLDVVMIRKDNVEVTLRVNGSGISVKGDSSIICTFADKNRVDAEPAEKDEVDDIPKLTGREKEVLKLICEGYSNAEIAEKLYISERTVEGHRSRLFSKTNTKNAVTLAMWAVRKGLFEAKT